MSVEKCAVPNCNNPTTTGIPFPKQLELQEKWLQSLKIPDFVPTPGSFVCLDHFGDKDLLENVATDSYLENILEELPIPVLVPQSQEEVPDPMLVPQSSEEPPSSIAVPQTHPPFVEDTTNGNSEEKGKIFPSLACRLCLGTNEVNVCVFDKFEDKEITISAAIMHCIPSIRITKQDHYCKVICRECFKLVQLFHKFRETCLQSDIKLRESSQERTQKRKIQEDVAENMKKVCIQTESNDENVKKMCTQNEVKDDVKKLHGQGEFNVDDEKKMRVQSESSDENFQLKRSEIDEKFDRVEAELMKALEGKLGEELKGADNIIIEVQSDDEVDNQDNVLVNVGSEQLKLPKGIKVSINQAKVGLCDAKVVQGINNSEFCLVDNYLFEYRLCKGNIRHLRCLVTRCRAVAQQKMLESGKFENKVWVKVAHNHPPPSEEERKKQMFLHSLHRKMQSDKTLNFRCVYEEFCEKDPELKKLVPLKTVINQICCQQMSLKSPSIHSFEQFYDCIENDEFQKLHFTHTNKQFYQEKFTTSNGAKAVVFANCDTIEQVSDSTIMYVDASFKIETKENFNYHLVTILVWVNDSYYPILFALVNEKSQEIYKAIFNYLHDILAPRLRPDEIVTDYEASLYYSLGETYLDSHIGGSVFYYTQNLYKKICSLNLSRELETNSCFRNIYHMILMLPLLPVNTILDGLNNIELQAAEMGQAALTAPIFEYVKSQWMTNVTPDLFCVHRLENRINENVIAPFKKLRDFLMLSKGKVQKQQVNIVLVVEKLIELEGFLQMVYSAPTKKSFSRDLSSSQKKNVIRAWQYIESHPKININNFFTKVLGYIKCMENQLWIWGFYRYTGDANDELISAANFSIVNSNESEEAESGYEQTDNYIHYVYPEDEVVMDVVIDQKDGFLVKETETQEEIEVHEEFQGNYIT